MADETGRPRNRRRKDARPQEIVEAALEAFALNGYAATRLDDVARRAGISKGTIYLYFDSKEELFKAMVRRSVVPQVERMEDLAGGFDGSAEALLRALLKTFGGALRNSEIREVARLLIAEAGKFPDIADFYFNEVIARGMTAIRRIVARGVATGEFRRTALADFPQALVAPVILGVVWKSLFDRHHPLDVDGFMEAHLDVVLNGLKAT